ncbi:MAG: stationary-phase survival protein SurE [Acidimicrobiaceae bacterium]|nr:stationary-phase survival protein SurE [Acidimicrobiaceae bacterium]
MATEDSSDSGAESSRPLILVTNDDGVMSPGLAAAAEAVMDLGELLMVAPARQQTAMGHSRPRYPTAGRIVETKLELRGESVTAYAVDGSPAQCVAHALMELSDRLPALCVSGINYGENLGHSLTVSGTVGAALEASAFRIPGIATSRELSVDVDIHGPSYPELDWTVASHFTSRLAEQVLDEGLPGDVAVLNLNVPDSATFETPVRVTHQSRQSYYIHRRPSPRDLGEPFALEMIVEMDLESLESESDVLAFAVDRVVSVTPLSGSLTARSPWRPR